MMFRAKTVEPVNMKSLATIASVASKLCKSCCLRINKNSITVLIFEDVNPPRQVMVWCTINSMKFFNEYAMDGLTDSNEILMMIPSDMLYSSLSMLKQGSNVTNIASAKLKLTSKHCPCLSIEMELMSDFSLPRTCLHDIPVKIVLPDEWKYYPPPPEFNYSLSLEVFGIRKVRNVLDRLKKFCQHVAIGGGTDGSLVITADTDTATVKTIIKNNRVNNVEDAGKTVSVVKVDSKRLTQLLVTEQINPKSANCNFLDEKLLHFHFIQEAFEMNFFIVGIVE